jgi:hypothetical protein
MFYVGFMVGSVASALVVFATLVIASLKVNKEIGGVELPDLPRPKLPKAFTVNKKRKPVVRDDLEAFKAENGR